MVRVLVDRDVYTAVPMAEVQKAAKRVEAELLHDPPTGAKKKWEHIVAWDGTRIALVCEWKQRDDLVLITRARRLKGRKKPRGV